MIREIDMAAELDRKNKKKILVVEDDEDIRNLIIFNLSLNDEYKIFGTDTGEEALKIAAKVFPDLIILDIMLPGIDGFEVCRQLKAGLGTRNIPVVMLTARADDKDVIRGYELGVEDYMRKPFSSMKILLARVSNVLKRHENSGENIIQIDTLSIDVLSRTVTVDGRPVELSNSEFRILELLAGNPGVAYSRDVIMNYIKAEDSAPKKLPNSLRSIDVQVLAVRKKLGTCGRYIQTVRGTGYIFKAE
ncbi:MAG: response regulator transcription factor [Spirochaetia bacterium]|nr:response regulator transcription factor [Spirochaetia bacterium]